MIRRWPLTSLLVVVSLVLVVWWLPGGLGNQPASAPPPVAPAPSASKASAPAADAGGHLVIDPDLRRFFDSALSSAGNAPLEVPRQKIRRTIDQRLPPVAAQEALDLLEKYLRYRERAPSVAAGPDAVSAVAERIEQLRILRGKIFGERMAGALFGGDEEHDVIAAEIRRVAADEALSVQERLTAIELLEEMLAPAEREARQKAFGPLRSLQDEAAFRQAGGSDAEVRLLRLQRVEPESAEQLEADEPKLAGASAPTPHRAKQAAKPHRPPEATP